ncbi:MAG: hypothetical protein V4468_08275 [Pseudomonadota bacterium]
MATTTNNAPALATMRAALEQYIGGQLAADGLVRSWREAAPGLVLPPMFGQAMEELLRRLEMAAVFAQDSCSFSSTAVTDQLKRWLDKAATA